MSQAPDAIDEIRYTTQPLPRTCAPLPHETMSSYLYRLASANSMDPETLRTLVAGDSHKDAWPRPAVLSRLSDRPEHALLHALPELRPATAERRIPKAWRTGPGCKLCNAARGAGRYAQVWRAPDDVLCLRHQRWTTGPDDGDQQPYLVSTVI